MCKLYTSVHSLFNYFSLLQYHRGRSPQTEQWVLDIVDISTCPATGYMQLIDRRTQLHFCPLYNSMCSLELLCIQMSGQPILEYLQQDTPIHL